MNKSSITLQKLKESRDWWEAVATVRVNGLVRAARITVGADGSLPLHGDRIISALSKGGFYFCSLERKFFCLIYI